MFINEYTKWEKEYPGVADSFIFSGNATVTGIKEVNEDDITLYYIVLDRTPFFPEGGGQPGDQGLLNDIPVLNTIEEEGVIYHITNKAICVGTKVFANVSHTLRRRRMQLHSAEHLLCGLIHNETSFDNVGFHMSDDTTVTFDVSGPLSFEEVLSYENKANEIIFENRAITVSYPKDEEISSLNFRSKLEFTKNVRLITIDGIDVCACCAPHVNFTAQIGIIKILCVIPHRGGTRIEMTAGISALEDYRNLDENNKKIMQLLSAKRSETYEKVQALSDRNFSLSGKINDLKKLLCENTINEVRERLKECVNKNCHDPFLIFGTNMDDKSLRNLINECTEHCQAIVAGFLPLENDEGFRYIISVNPSVKDKLSKPLPVLAKELNAKFNGRGGGNFVMVQGQVLAKKEALADFFTVGFDLQ